MSRGDDLVQQAIAAYKGGQRITAGSAAAGIGIDGRHEQAWLWLSAVVDDLDRQQICLENVLALNPANERARRAWDRQPQDRRKASQSVRRGRAGAARFGAVLCTGERPAPPTPAGTSLPGSPDDLPDWAQPAGPGGSTRYRATSRTGWPRRHKRRRFAVFHGQPGDERGLGAAGRSGGLWERAEG